jgi:hypothetical protein
LESNLYILINALKKISLHPLSCDIRSVKKRGSGLHSEDTEETSYEVEFQNMYEVSSDVNADEIAAAKSQMIKSAISDGALQEALRDAAADEDVDGFSAVSAGESSVNYSNEPSTSESSSSSSDSSSDSPALTTGAVAGIAIGCFVGSALLFGLFAYLYKRRSVSSHDNAPVTHVDHVQVSV